MGSVETLGLVQDALGSFESVPLSRSVRNAWRIARLVDDPMMAYWFELQSSPPGGSKTLNKLAALDLPGDDPEKTRALVFRTWLDERAISKSSDDDHGSADDDRVLVFSISEIEKFIDELEAEGGAMRSETQQMRTIFDRTQARTLRFLVGAESQLLLSTHLSSIFDRHRLRVDQFLSDTAPDVRDKLNSANERAAAGDAESMNQALGSCRRALSALADSIFPASMEPHIDAAGTQRGVGQQQYKNRLLAAIDEAATARTQKRLVGGTLKSLAERLDALNDTTSKGVHDGPVEQEVDFCVIQTYIVIGEILELCDQV